MKIWITGLVLLFVNASARSATVDTVDIYSNAMHRAYKCVVIVPDSPDSLQLSFPVVYLLHGYSGNYSNWVKIVPEIKDYADKYGIIIVCPDGAYGSWYIDSPIDSSFRFETYISKEVPAFIDSHFKTIHDNKYRAITGLSMGGHGGLFLAFRHPDVFGACGSMSGGFDLRPFAKSWDISKRIGDSVSYPLNWKSYSVITVAAETKTFPAAIIFDCGTEDFFYQTNQALHNELLTLHVPHEYIERPGKHDWAYWANSVRNQLFYFYNYFMKTAGLGK